MDCSKAGNYAEPEVRKCLIPSTFMQEEITPLQSQLWPPSDTWPTGAHCADQFAAPLLASGRLWEIATGWLLSPTEPINTCR